MKILIAADAWFPQVSGVVRTFSSVVNELIKIGHKVKVIDPSQFSTIPCPTYPEIRLALVNFKKLTKIIQDFDPEAIHIAVEGTIGLATRNYCIKKDYHSPHPIQQGFQNTFMQGFGYLSVLH